MKKEKKKPNLNFYYKYDKRNNKNKVNLVPIIFYYNYLILNLFLLIPYIIITIFDFILLFYSSIDLP